MIRSVLSIVVLITLFGPSINAQDGLNDTINQLDINGEKTGFWIESLDNELLPTIKKNEVITSRYCYYDHGKRVYPIIGISSGKYLLEYRTSRSDTSLIDGAYNLRRKKSGILEEEGFYKNGILLWTKTYYKNGKVNEFIQYRFDSSISCICERYTSKGEVIERWCDEVRSGKWRSRPELQIDQ